MEDKVLSAEQMRELIGMGIDTSTASCYWFKHIEPDMGWSLFTRKPAKEFTYIPTFTLQDILEMLPPTIEWKGQTYWFGVYINGFGNKMMGYRDSEKWPLEYANMNINGAYKLLKTIKTVYNHERHRTQTES